MTTWENGYRRVGQFELWLEINSAGVEWVVTSSANAYTRSIVAKALARTKDEAMAAADAWAMRAVKEMAEALGILLAHPV